MKSVTILAVVLFSLACHAQHSPIDSRGRDVGQPCVDSSDLCVAWAPSYCDPASLYYNYMKKNCRKSCNFCSPVNITPIEPIPVEPMLPPVGPIRDFCASRSCMRPVCGPGQILHQDEGECYPKCIVMPSKGCRPVYRQVRLNFLEI